MGKKGRGAVSSIPNVKRILTVEFRKGKARCLPFFFVIIHGKKNPNILFVDCRKSVKFQFERQEGNYLFT
jgi:hypothetical protein